jgi:DNA-binding XRE family transcriptional regulator
MDNTSDKNFFIPVRDVVRLETPIRDRFRVLLSRIGRSQNWLAGQCEVSNGTMSRIANGDWFPSSPLMIKICETLDVDSSALFGDSKYWKEYSDKIRYGGNEE